MFTGLLGRLLRPTMWLLGSAAALSVAATMLGTSAGATRPRPRLHAPGRADIRLGHTEALRLFQDHGIGWRANGKCTDREQADCTSFEGLREVSVDGLLDFHRRSGCPLTVSGGTETGHAPGPYSHSNGFKLDVMPNRCVDGFIEHSFPYVGMRGDGSPMYRGPGGYTFADEHGTHWDIVFSPAWRPTGHDTRG